MRSLFLLVVVIVSSLLFFKEKRKTYVEGFVEYFSNIPKVVYQTYSSYENIPDCVKKVMAENKEKNPEYVFKFFDDNAIEDYIKYNTSSDVYRAFTKINSKCGACKADFFRYVIMYNEGGIYADIKTKFKVNLDQWIHNNTKLKLTLWPWLTHSHLDKYYHPNFKPSSNNREINQAVLIFPPKHPLMKQVIDKMIINIEDQHISKKRKSVLETTGPHLFTSVIAPQLGDYDIELMEDGDNLYNGNVLYDGTGGCYHETQRKQNLRYSNLNKIIL